MEYNVQTVRAAGLQARWTRTRSGAPIIAARLNDNDTWYVIHDSMWREAQNIGLLEAFKGYTALGEFFSVPA